MSKRVVGCVIGLLVACGCRGKPRADAPSGEAFIAQEQPRVPAAVPRTARDSALTVTASPDAPRELALPNGTVPIDIAGSPTHAQVFVLLRDTAGRSRVVAWDVTSDTSTPIAELPPGFSGRAIASHPFETALFVAGLQGEEAQVLKLAREGAVWRSEPAFATARPIERLIVGPRRFNTADGETYRLFFAAHLPDGNSSLRSVTERGGQEYQVVGPRASVDTLGGERGPDRVDAPSGVPMAFHPRGEPLLWRDRSGCTHLLPYGSTNWFHDALVAAVPCGAWLSFTPNGAALLVWRSGSPGVALVTPDGRALGQGAMGYTFVAAPVSVPDGRGVIGIVSKGGTSAALVFAPIAVPLADVANAWQLARNACDERLFNSNSGLFREVRSPGQLYSLYESSSYGAEYEAPNLVTTDLEWEEFGAAFNGVFILLERRHAVPAFRAFVAAANDALNRAAPGSRWAKAFAAVTAFYAGADSGEAGRIAHEAGRARSTVLDSTMNFGDLLPRGHYTSSAEMQRYFRAMHYLTTLGHVIDPAPLGRLPADVQQRAVEWIAVYRPFIAPSRSRSVWRAAEGRSAPYAKHPWRWTSLFPLSWGLDNEVLESSVFHNGWPPEEQIVAPRGLPRRVMASGGDVAAVFGNSLARSLLAPDFATFPPLRPVLEAIAARRPGPSEGASLYERWLDAIGVEWADSSTFPGTRPSSPVWPAKRLQTGLASWTTLREATILVTERAEGAEAGEGGFEALLPEQPRGYVEPAPRTFEAIASLYDALARAVAASHDLGATGGEAKEWTDQPLQQGIERRLAASATEARRFAEMAKKELRNEALSDSDYDAIRAVGGSIEHQFLVYKSLSREDLAISTPEPLLKIADVTGSDSLGLLEAAVGEPLAWEQIVPFFGRREIAIGSVYSYYEFQSFTPYTNEKWRGFASHPHPIWVQALIAPAKGSCRAVASR